MTKIIKHQFSYAHRESDGLGVSDQFRTDGAMADEE